MAILARKDAAATIDQIFKEYSEAELGEPYLFEGSSDGADAYGFVTI